MPVTTRQGARTFASQSASTSQGRQQVISQSTLAAPSVPRRRRTAQTKAETIPRCLPPSSFESLPTEIIELIAEKLRDQELEQDGSDADDFYEAASEVTEHPPPCECQYAHGSLPANRESAKAKIAERFHSCEPTIPLSSTSRRLRSIVFDHRPDRIKVVKYCKSSMQASEAMTAPLRESVRKLSVRAEPRHTAPDLNEQIIHCLMLFPKIQVLNIDWNRTMSGHRHQLITIPVLVRAFPQLKTLIVDIPEDPYVRDVRYGDLDLCFSSAARELGLIFAHLPLAHVEGVTIRIRDAASSPLEDDFGCYRKAFERMRLPRLKIFTAELTLEIDTPLEGECIWNHIETTFVNCLHQASITTVTLFIDLMILGCPHAVLGSGIFLPTRNSHATISPTLMPTKARLLQLFEKLRGSCENLIHLSIYLTGDLAHVDHADTGELDLLDFQVTMAADNDARRDLATDTSYDRFTCRHSGVTGNDNLEVEYEVDQEMVNRLAKRVEESIVEIALNFNEEDDEESSDDRNTTNDNVITDNDESTEDGEE